MRETCGLEPKVAANKDGESGKTSLMDEIVDDSDTETTIQVGKQGEILDECLAEIAMHMMEKGIDVRMCVYLYMYTCVF